MATLTDVQAAAFTLANKDVVFNPESAFAKKWLELKQEGYLIGVPIGPEIPLHGGVAQPFTSGAVLVWKGGTEAQLV